MKALVFFSVMAGVGKTTLVQHVAWMCAEQGFRVLVADLDPQLSLTARFLDENQIVARLDTGGPVTIGQALSSMINGGDDLVEPAVIEIADHLALLPGDPGLSLLDDGLSPDSSTVAVADLIRGAGRRWGADLILIDLGSNFGALNRAAAVAADYLIVPMVPGGLFLKNLEYIGKKIEIWRANFEVNSNISKKENCNGTSKILTPIGYVVSRIPDLHRRPSMYAVGWLDRIPAAYRLELAPDIPLPAAGEPDPCCLAVLKSHYALAAYAAEVRKPMFHLTPADGAIGSHQAAVRQCYAEFAELVRRIALATGLQPSRH